MTTVCAHFAHLWPGERQSIVLTSQPHLLYFARVIDARMSSSLFGQADLASTESLVPAASILALPRVLLCRCRLYVKSLHQDIAYMKRE